MNSNTSRWCKIALLLSTTVLLPACATYSDRLHDVYNHLEQHQPSAALAAHEKKPGPARDHLAFLLNNAMLLRMTGDYAASNQAFEQAKMLITKLDAVSLREQAGALTINETMRSYPGEPHEHVLLHLYAALNYLQAGQLDSARVEALQVNLRLQELSKKNKAEANDEIAIDKHYNEDPFAYYLTAMIYEELNEWSDAMIAYRDAYQAYQRYATSLNIETPEFLKHDLLRLSEKMGLDDELAGYKKTFNITDFTSVSDLNTQGELIFILHNGLAPQKKQHTSSTTNFSTGRLVTISLPYYLSKNKHATLVQAHINNQQPAVEMVTNIDTVAKQTLKAKLPALTARAIARAIMKDNAAQTVEDTAGGLAGFIVNIAATVSEVADTRSWWSLPHNIQILRIPLPAGDYNLTIQLQNNELIEIDSIDFNNIIINTGHKTFIEHHWIKATSGLTHTSQEDHNET